MGEVWSALRGAPLLALLFSAALILTGAFGGLAGFALALDGHLGSQDVQVLLGGATFALGLGVLLQIGLWGTLRDRVFEGRSDDSFLSVLGDAGARMPRIAAIGLGIVFVQSLLACLPGLVILALSPILYLTAAWPDASWRRCVYTGSHWLKIHALTLATLLAASYMFNGVLWGGLYAFGILGYSATPYIFKSTLGLGFVGAGVLLAAAAIKVAYFVATVSTFVAMERKAEG
jgi:hypothetical protein